MSSATPCIASTAYDSGSRSEMNPSTAGISSRATNRPHSRICGITTSGMNCTAWNSVRANAETKSPSAVPRTASAIATRVSIQTGPCTSRSSTRTREPHRERRLDGRDQPEREGVAAEEVELAHRHRQQPLERAGRPLPQRGHAGHQEHDDEREQRQQGGAERPERQVVEHPPQQRHQRAREHQEHGQGAVVAPDLVEHAAGDGEQDPRGHGFWGPRASASAASGRLGFMVSGPPRP